MNAWMNLTLPNLKWSWQFHFHVSHILFVQCVCCLLSPKCTMHVNLHWNFIRHTHNDNEFHLLMHSNHRMLCTYDMYRNWIEWWTYENRFSFSGNVVRAWACIRVGIAGLWFKKSTHTHAHRDRHIHINVSNDCFTQIEYFSHLTYMAEFAKRIQTKTKSKKRRNSHVFRNMNDKWPIIMKK